MNHIVLVTTSYPDDSEGAAAAGTFVKDFAQALSAHARVTVIAPGTTGYTTHEHQVQVQRFAVPRQPLSLLSPLNPAHWPLIIQTLRAGQQQVMHVCAATPVTHLLALWTLPSGYWALQAGRRWGIPYSIWALGSDIWTLGKIPGVRTILRQVLRNAIHRYADGLALKDDVERIGGKPCAFLPSCRVLTDGRAKTLRDSRIESIPVIFSDAMQMRCPVIAMPVGDLPQLIAKHRCGMLAATATAPGLAQALRQALT